MDSTIINLTIEKNNKPSLSSDFDNYLAIKEKGFNEKIPCNLHFYEWSDLNQERIFETHDAFFKFLMSSHIFSSWSEDKQIKLLAHTQKGVYIICKTGTHKLIIENSFEKLKEEFEKSNQKKDEEPKKNYRQYDNPCYARCYDDEYDYD